MDIMYAGYERNRISNPTIYDRGLDVVEFYSEDGESEGLELYAYFETGPNVEYCSAWADKDGSINPGYPMGNAARYRVIASRVSWCEARIYFGIEG